MGHPQVIWSTPVMTQDGGMPAQFQGDREGFTALPRNARECVVVLLPEAYAVIVYRLSDAPPGREPIVVVERVVDATVQAGDRRLRRRFVKRAERARLLGRHQLVIRCGGVGERLEAKIWVRTAAAAPDWVECPEI